MFKSSKEFSYCYEGDDIIIRKSSCFSDKIEVSLNGQNIAYYKNSFLGIKYNNPIVFDDEVISSDGSSYHLRVVCGMHFGIEFRYNIYVDGKYVLDIPERDIYCLRPILFFSLFSVLSPILLLSFGIISIIFIHNKVDYSKSKSKIVNSDFNLYQSDISKVLFKKNVKLKNIKKKDWVSRCHKNEDYHCRLASYLFAIDGDNQSRIDYAMKSCFKGYPYSCYQAYLARTFTLSNKSYKDVINPIIKSCTNDSILDDRGQKICYGFIRVYLRESNDLNTVKKISEKLCKEGFVKGCQQKQALNSEIIDFSLDTK